MTEKENVELKILIIGESGVGKTSILQRFIEDNFKGSFASTIGVDFRSKKIQVGNKEVELQIWDTAGQERFFSITKSYYRGSDGVFLTFDISSESSFKNTEKWVSTIKSRVEKDVPIFLLANKKDLVPESGLEALATIKSIKELSAQLHMPWYATSAQSGENIEEIFIDIAGYILSQRKMSTPKKKRFVFSTKSLRKAFSCW